MKRRDLERQLKDLGWAFDRPGGSHDIWRRGDHTLAVPRHTEIKENTARRILKDAK